MILYHLVTARATVSLGGEGTRAEGPTDEHPIVVAPGERAERGRVSDTASRGTAPAHGDRRARLEQLSIDTIRTLTMDAVQAANSGHPGMPMAMAPAAYLLYTRYLKHNPADPAWPDRDRFVLSAGHGSMLLYSVLHLTGYELPLDEIKNFRQWESLTPGHPERDRVHVTPGRRDDHRARSARASPTASAWRWPSASCASATAPR